MFGGGTVHDNGDVRWRTSSYSGTSGCVEVGRNGDEILIRDSKNPRGGRLAIDRSAWRIFVAAVRAGEFR
jgi:hypothetical protein